VWSRAIRRSARWFCEAQTGAEGWSFSYSTDIEAARMLGQEQTVAARTQDIAAISGVRGRRRVETRNGGSKPRSTGRRRIYRSFELMKKRRRRPMRQGGLHRR